MKKICFVLVSVMLLLSGATAKAQFGTGKRFVNTVEAVYSPVTLSANILGSDFTYKMNAVSLDFAQAYALAESSDFYVQYSAVIQYSWGASVYMNKPMHLLSLNVPVNLAYDISFPDSKISVVPYAGLNFQEHMLGQSGGINLFDEDDMGDYTFDDFMISWQAGAKFVYDRYILGVAYQGPLSSLLEEDDMKIRLSQINISLGVRF